MVRSIVSVRPGGIRFCSSYSAKTKHKTRNSTALPKALSNSRQIIIQYFDLLMSHDQQPDADLLAEIQRLRARVADLEAARERERVPSESRLQLQVEHDPAQLMAR